MCRAGEGGGGGAEAQAEALEASRALARVLEELRLSSHHALTLVLSPGTVRGRSSAALVGGRGRRGREGERGRGGSGLELVVVASKGVGEGLLRGGFRV